MVQQPNEPSTNDGDVATIDRKQIAQKLIASTKQQSKMLAMNALLSAASTRGNNLGTHLFKNNDMQPSVRIRFGAAAIRGSGS
jgi:hypothetical protein